MSRLYAAFDLHSGEKEGGRVYTFYKAERRAFNKVLAYPNHEELKASFRTYRLISHRWSQGSVFNSVF
jgi:hypothetical protein